MDTKIYQGKDRALEIKKDLTIKIAKLKKEKEIVPTLAIISSDRSRGTAIYTKMKEKFASEVGAKVEIYNLQGKRKNYKDVSVLIRYLCSEPSYNGVMLQLPVGRPLRDKRDYLINSISRDKDVDGLNDDSPFDKPVVMAINDAFTDFKKAMKVKKPKVGVLGHKGFVGRSVVKFYKEQGYEVEGVDKEMLNIGRQKIQKMAESVDIIVSATGRKAHMNKNMITSSVGFIDIGAPNPEIDYQEVKELITYYTPVPGGIGPVTIAYLLENLFKATYNQTR